MYEFVLVFRLVFVVDGFMLCCFVKSVFMVILEKFLFRLVDQRSISDGIIINVVQLYLKVIIIDGMVEFQCLDKLEWVKNCEQFVVYFVNIIEQKYDRKDEICLIFDWYDLFMLLKEVIREKR